MIFSVLRIRDLAEYKAHHLLTGGAIKPCGNR